MMLMPLDTLPPFTGDDNSKEPQTIRHKYDGIKPVALFPNLGIMLWKMSKQATR